MSPLFPSLSRLFLELLRTEKLGGGRGTGVTVQDFPLSPGMVALEMSLLAGVSGKSLRGFFGFPELGAWCFSAPSVWSSAVSALASPLVQRLSGFSFRPVWISVVAHSHFPLNSGIAVVHP